MAGQLSSILQQVQTGAKPQPYSFKSRLMGTPAANTNNAAGYSNASMVGGSPHDIGTPTADSSTRNAGPDYGSQSGPTAVEDRYYQRAMGTDPGWEYATGRASDAINRQYAARGGYNSSGAMQSLSDMYANAVGQREGQLDALSAQATGAHQNALNSMFSQAQGLASGQAGTAQGYDMASGEAQSQALKNQMELYLAQSGIDTNNAQSQLNFWGGIVGGGAKGLGAMMA